MGYKTAAARAAFALFILSAVFGAIATEYLGAQLRHAEETVAEANFLLSFLRRNESTASAGFGLQSARLLMEAMPEADCEASQLEYVHCTFFELMENQTIQSLNDSRVRDAVELEELAMGLAATSPPLYPRLPAEASLPSVATCESVAEGECRTGTLPVLTLIHRRGDQLNNIRYRALVMLETRSDRFRDRVNEVRAHMRRTEMVALFFQMLAAVAMLAYRTTPVRKEGQPPAS